MGQQAQQLKYPEVTEQGFLRLCAFEAQRFRALEKGTDVFQVDGAASNDLRDRDPVGRVSDHGLVTRIDLERLFVLVHDGLNLDRRNASETTRRRDLACGKTAARISEPNAETFHVMNEAEVDLGVIDFQIL